MIRKFVQFFQRDLWRFRASQVRGRKWFGLRTLRVFILSLREFNNDQCSLRASALTVYSLLSIVPVFAMAFGVAKGFGLDLVLKQKLLENMQAQKEVIEYIINFSENMLQGAKGGIIAGVGVALLFWSVIQVLTNVERAFNQIWGIQKGRGWGRKFSDYLSLMLIAPFLFLVGSSATVFIVSQVTMLTAKLTILGPLGPVILTALQIVPFIVFWGLLTYLYIFIPNGKINFSSALLGGIIAGTIYQLVQWAYVRFQIGASKAGAVYGTFAALPLFLVWLQTSWLIVLYGAELAFAHQNEDRFEFEQESKSLNERFRKLLALRITQFCVNRFVQGETPIAAEQIADALELPIRLTRDLLERLTQAQILVAIPEPETRTTAYQPARDVHDLTIHFVLLALEKSGSEDVPVAETPALDRLRDSLQVFDQTLEALPENFLLKDMAALDGKPSRQPQSHL